MIVIRNIVLLGVLLINIVNAQEINMKKFKLYSPTIEAGATLGKAQVANVFGCSGDNISPELRWRMYRKVQKVLHSQFMTRMRPPVPGFGTGW